MEGYAYLKFTGTYNQLKGLGYNFQKLYAGNYMQWCKNGFRIWKKGSEITHDSVDLYKLVKFLSTEPEVRERDGGISFYKFYRDGALDEYDYCPTTKENTERYGAYMKSFSADDYDESNPPEYLGDSIFVSEELLDQLKELDALGWYEVIDG